MPSNLPLLITNISKLLCLEPGHSGPLKGAGMATLNTVDNAWLLFVGEYIQDFGPMHQCPEIQATVIDANQGMVFPSWCDSHTHLVFAGSRENEFANRIKGMSYEEIARQGGGILNSAKRLRETSEKDLFDSAVCRLNEVAGYGTAAIEIKSGYGLSLESELKILRIIRRLSEESDLSIRSTFLGAHALPPEYRDNRKGYLDLIIHEMLPVIAAEGLADYIDVFCEKIAFSVPETDQLLEAGAKYGLKPKIHTNQFNCLGGIQSAIRHQAVSVDHLEVVNEEEMSALQTSDTIATLLPSAPFFLNDHYPPARQLLQANIAVALASDYNPGSSPSGNMPFVVSLACIKMKMTPEEAILAATYNGACAMELGDTHGCIGKGRVGNCFITKPIPSIAYLPYSFGSNLIDKIIIRGRLVSYQSFSC